jgi:hypothetical protein
MIAGNNSAIDLDITTVRPCAVKIGADTLDVDSFYGLIESHPCSAAELILEESVDIYRIIGIIRRID